MTWCARPPQSSDADDEGELSLTRCQAQQSRMRKFIGRCTYFCMSTRRSTPPFHAWNVRSRKSYCRSWQSEGVRSLVRTSNLGVKSSKISSLVFSMVLNMIPTARSLLLFVTNRIQTELSKSLRRISKHVSFDRANSVRFLAVKRKKHTPQNK